MVEVIDKDKTFFAPYGRNNNRTLFDPGIFTASLIFASKTET
jgi:hypothetical protein